MKSLIFLTILLLSPAVLAMDYDVDMPNSGDPKYEMVRITIDGCTSKFKIEKKEWEKFAADAKNLKNLVVKAVKRSSNGCPQQ